MDKKILLALDFKNAPETLKTVTQSYGQAEKQLANAQTKLTAAEKAVNEAKVKVAELEKAFNAELNAWTPAVGV